MATLGAVCETLFKTTDLKLSQFVLGFYGHGTSGNGRSCSVVKLPMPQ